MTWIVGVPVPFGYAIGCADIRVTFKDGREEDCLQKIYQVGPVVCAAFAGSVQIGFALLSRTAQLLKRNDPGMAWDLDEVAKWWPQDAREVWNCMPDFEQQLKSEFMLFGAHPNQANPWPKPCVYTFRSPQFEAVPNHGAFGGLFAPQGRKYPDLLRSPEDVVGERRLGKARSGLARRDRTRCDQSHNGQIARTADQWDQPPPPCLFGLPRSRQSHEK